MKHISCLTDREDKVISLRFNAGRTLSSTADFFSSTPERIRSVEAKALRKMRHYKNKQRAIDDIMRIDFMAQSKKERLICAIFGVACIDDVLSA